MRFLHRPPLIWRHRLSEFITMHNRVHNMLAARAVLAAAGLLALAPGARGDDPPSEHALNVPPPGYIALFNGKDLTGWKGLVLNPKQRATMSAEEHASGKRK